MNTLSAVIEAIGKLVLDRGMAEMQFGRELVLREQICAIQLFGRKALERIPAGSIIFAEHPSNYVRMIEVVWQQRRYLVFQRDLEERTKPSEQLA
ncbi:MAG TPA: hypothetical protein VME17_07040 [Bryobacteraceae bacterium]|nr:hypothetical protein [Bryobacteraceae bacterium]